MLSGQAIYGATQCETVSPNMNSTGRPLIPKGPPQPALMGLLFAFGVMNLLWVASISGFVLLEKITSGNQLVSRLGGLLFIGWAAWIVFGS